MYFLPQTDRFQFWRRLQISFPVKRCFQRVEIMRERELPAISTALVKSYSRCSTVMNNFQNLSGPPAAKASSFLFGFVERSFPTFVLLSRTLIMYPRAQFFRFAFFNSTALLHSSLLRRYFFLIRQASHPFWPKRATNICFQKWVIRKIAIR